MEITITAVGPDNVRLVDPIIHYVTVGGSQYRGSADVQPRRGSAVRDAPADRFSSRAVCGIAVGHGRSGRIKNLSIRVWSPELRRDKPRLAFCTTYRQEPVLALLRAIRDGQIRAEPAVMIGNRNSCRGIAEQFHLDWHMIGDSDGRIDDERLVALLDEYDVDYVILARFMRVLAAATCWKYAGGRIVNLHHGLLPGFPGMRPYHDAHASRMLTFGATCHFIVPELDAGNQIIHQSTFTVPPGATLDEITRIGQEDNEPRCLVEGVRRVVRREVQLHFHRVVAQRNSRLNRIPSQAVARCAIDSALRLSPGRPTEARVRRRSVKPRQQFLRAIE